MRREASRHRPSPSPIPTQEACSPSRHPIDGRTGRVEPRAGPSGLGPPAPTPPAAPPRPPGLCGAARRAGPSSPGLVRAGPEHHPQRRLWPGPLRAGHVSVTHNQRGLQRGPAPEQPASHAPATGGLAGGTGQRELKEQTDFLQKE